MVAFAFTYGRPSRESVEMSPFELPPHLLLDRPPDDEEPSLLRPPPPFWAKAIPGSSTRQNATARAITRFIDYLLRLLIDQYSG
jgi:hypothetical protein